MKKITTVILGVATFTAGTYYSDNIKQMRSVFHEQHAEGFHPRPYDLKLVRKKDNGKIETYILDTQTNKYTMIGPNLSIKRSRTNRIRAFIKIFKFINGF